MTDQQASTVITLLTAILGQLEYMNAIIDQDSQEDALAEVQAQGSA